MARWQRKRSACPSCTGDRAECNDPEHDWYAYRIVCYRTMAAAAANAKWERLHADAPYHDGTFNSWVEKRSDAHPFHFSEGVTIGVSRHDMNPDDNFLG
ncbi:hypothetical protein GCM10027600_43200 [Nocardioides ginsengisegetis]